MVPKAVIVCDVAARDGLQIEKKLLTTSEKVRLIEAICQAGVPKVEVTSFVNPKVVPQMADAEELLMTLSRLSQTRFVALVPNVKGLERALNCAIKEVKLVVSASESHNRANVRMSIEDSLKNVATIMRETAGSGAE